jgi:hypothetical protein
MKSLLRVPDLSQFDHEDYSEDGKYGRRSIYREDRYPCRKPKRH